MNLLQKQSYNVWYSFLVDKLLQWQKQKPNNKDISNCVKAITEIGMFTNTLLTEVEVITKRESLVRNENNKEIIKLKEELKQYEL
tara:strand:+ start:217 stop:471 length:255 start_codon:yes stop_codon:yes gene_type:complete